MSPSQLGYTYPEFNGLDLGNQDAVRTRIAQVVNDLYGPSRRGRSIFSPVMNLATSAPQAAMAKSSSQPSGESDDEPDVPVTISGGEGAAPGGYWEWTARIRFKKYALGCSFSVLLFLGEVPEDPAEWRMSPNYAGAHHAFVNSAPQRCANCRRQAELVIEGFVHLNEAIASHSGLGTFDPDAVKPYLQENLHWRVQKVSDDDDNVCCMPGSHHDVMQVDGTVVDLDDIQSLEVFVVATHVSLPPGATFPVPEHCIFHRDVTQGQRGGARDDDNA